MNFGDRLDKAVREKESVAVIGIDPRVANLPPALRAQAEQGGDNLTEAFAAFGQGIVDAVQEHVPAVKPNIAFFEAHGLPGLEAYNLICAHARRKGLLVIGDVKRGDIGSTASAYASGLLAGALGNHDALTLNPYLGTDSIKPFLDAASERDQGVFVLVKTSNPSSKELQDLKLASGETVAEAAAGLVAAWGSEDIGESGLSSVGAVVGATHPRELARYRELMPHAPFLVPGYGAQGGSADDVVGAFHDNGSGALVNASRSVIFAWQKDDSPDDWQEATRRAACTMNLDLLTALKCAGKWG